MTIYFEHALDKIETAELREGIIYYELFLRYYVTALRYSGFPFAFHTIGSSMAVRADVYAKTGGMNRRKAGEDFYFLHKVAPQGDLLEVRDTTVYPSARISDRVPFGTGKAQWGWITERNTKCFAYNTLTFKSLNTFFSSLNLITDFNTVKSYQDWFQIQDEVVQAYLLHENFEKKYLEILDQTTQKNAFLKRFYTWWDGFKILKFVHFARDHFYPQLPIEEASRQMLQWHTGRDTSTNVEDLLMIYRKFDKTYNADFR